MRGPGYKLTGDVRRTWRCSNCGFERKLPGDITTLLCRCKEGAWMKIVAERILVPRPVQRPSDVERHPIDFGIEPPPPAPPKPEATIVKSAIVRDDEPGSESAEIDPESIAPEKNIAKADEVDVEDDWGEGIL